MIRQDLISSHIFNIEGDSVPITIVRQLPVKLSCNNLVNLESLKVGILLPPDKALITLPNVESDKLILLSSLNCY